MPELPEVETIRRGLEKYLVGHKITGVEVRLGKMISGDTKKVLGTKVKNVRRAGKGLIIELDNNYSIAIHIKLTGQLIYQGSGVPKGIKISDKVGGQLPNKWTHVIFKLKVNLRPEGIRPSSVEDLRSKESGKLKVEDAYLYYNDIRQFGWIKIVKTDEVAKLPFFKELGPEPPVAKAMGGQAPLTLELFEEIVSKSSTKIKPLLMDQKKIGGIGNIYANEALWVAGIDPRRTAKSLSSNEQSKLYDAILEVLKKGLKEGGATEINFVNLLGQEGGYQHHFLVYGQEGEPCPHRHGLIQKVRLGGRGTYFCPRCQR